MKMIDTKVLVRMNPPQSVSIGGMIIPERSRTTELWGTVECAGCNVKDLREGDEVMIQSHLGTHLRLKGLDYIIIEEEKISVRRETVI